jgi:urease accessory protein
MNAVVAVAAGARLLWREELVLGRAAELAGSVTTGIQVDCDGRPLLRQELALGPAHPSSTGSAIVGDARAAGSVVLVDPAWARAGGPAAAVLGPCAALLCLDGPGAQIVALAPEALALRRTLDAAIGASAGATPDSETVHSYRRGIV